MMKKVGCFFVHLFVWLGAGFVAYHLGSLSGSGELGTDEAYGALLVVTIIPPAFTMTHLFLWAIRAVMD